MSDEGPGGSLALVKVKDLRLESRNVNIIVKVASKGETREIVSRRDGTSHEVSDVLVGDETGSIYLTLWDKDIEKVKEGDVVQIRNGYVTLFRGSMRLNVGRYGSLEPSGVTLAEVNTENNLSEKRFEEPRPSYPRFGGGFRGGGRRPFRRGRRLR